MGKFIDKFLNRKTSTNPTELEIKASHTNKLLLMVAELEDIRKYWDKHPSYPDSKYCPVRNKIYNAEDYLRQIIMSMKQRKS